MAPIDRSLLEGRPRRAVFLPTASALEGPDRVRYWTDLGTKHFTGLGVEPVALPVLDRNDADSEDLAALVAGAGLVYLSGGNPGYLADTLAGTKVWEAIVAAFSTGAALAGCSAGACALSRVAQDLRDPGRYSGEGLGVVGDLVVLPHFDRMALFAPGLVSQMLATMPEGTFLVGIDEETALICDGGRYTVAGRQSVWHVRGDGSRTGFAAGEVLDLAGAQS